MERGIEHHVKIQSRRAIIEADIFLPHDSDPLVIFSHGSGSSRFSPRNRYVAKELHKAGFGTVMADLLSKEEDAIYENRFDINLLTERLTHLTGWLKEQPALREMNLGLFGASTGAASALRAAATLPGTFSALVSRGGRPDLAGKALALVNCPVLLIVGSRDHTVLELNQIAYERLNCEKKLSIVEGATHLFEEPGCLEAVAELAEGWFSAWLKLKNRTQKI